MEPSTHRCVLGRCGLGELAVLLRNAFRRCRITAAFINCKFLVIGSCTRFITKKKKGGHRVLVFLKALAAKHQHMQTIRATAVINDFFYFFYLENKGCSMGEKKKKRKENFTIFLYVILIHLHDLLNCKCILVMLL